MKYFRLILCFVFLSACTSARWSNTQPGLNNLSNEMNSSKLVYFKKGERVFNQNRILGLISIEPKSHKSFFTVKSTSYYGKNNGEAYRIINLWTHLSDFKNDKGQSKDPMVVAADFARAMNISADKAVIVSTSAYLEDAVYIEGESKSTGNIWGVFITLGIGNAISVFDDIDSQRPDLAGTINTTLLSDAKLNEQVYLSLISKISEIKASTLHSLNIKSRKVKDHFAIGTNSDTVTIASNESGKKLNYFGYNDADYSLISKLVAKAIGKSVQNYCTRIHSKEYQFNVAQTKNYSANYAACNEINIQQLNKITE